MSRLFTSESVTEGHPDKVADSVSDHVLDALLREDHRSRVAVETLVTTGTVVVAGEVTTSGYADIAKIAPYGVVSQVKTEVSPNGKKEEADLARVIKILKDANFHGYVALEYEAAEDPKVAVPKYVKQLRKLIGG